MMQNFTTGPPLRPMRDQHTLPNHKESRVLQTAVVTALCAHCLLPSHTSVTRPSGDMSSRGRGRSRPPAPATSEEAAPGVPAENRAARYGFPSGFDPAAFFDPTAEAMFANMPVRKSLTGGRGIVKHVIIPEKEK